MKRFISVLYRIINPFRKIIRQVFKSHTLGVRAIIFNQENKVLLVKHHYIQGWYLPGGGVDKAENFIQALKRELDEELGISVDKINSLLGIYTNNYELKNDHIAIFVITEFSVTPKQSHELEEYGYFDLDNLPETISPGTRKRLLEYQKLKEIDFIW